MLATPGYSEPNSMQDLRLIDQHLLNKRLQGIVDEEIADIEGKSEEEEDYEDMLHMDVAQTDDAPPPLPPRQLKYEIIINNYVLLVFTFYYNY